ncbi:type II secretion system protein GspG, partial [Actinomycetota bacterium]
GIPAMGGDEKEAIKKIAGLGLNCSVLAWNRPVRSDIEASIECGVDAVALSISSSDIHIEHKLMKSREWVLETMKSGVDFAKSHNLYVSVNAEDASRSDMEFLLQFARTARDAGADRLRYCDTLGILDPFETFMRVKNIIDIIGIDMEMHTHNDFGMAIANAIAGIKAGATYVNTTINGLGERAGNAAFEELVMALKYIEGVDMGFNTTLFRNLSEYVARASNRVLPTWKPIVGGNLFVHEIESKVSGIMANPLTYELFKETDVGLKREYVLGKYSGVNTTTQKGFTLIELLIVIIILAILTGVSIPVYRLISGRARESAAESEMTNIAKAVEMHQVDLQAYPLSSDYPDALEDNDYMEYIPLLDPWGNSYIYTSDGSSYSLESYGINGIDGGNDNILIVNGVLTDDGAYENR